jgi:hypothetical protein
MRISVAILSAILASSAHVTALGINCRGSSNCGTGDRGANLDAVVSAANSKPVGDDHLWFNGDHIACVSNGGNIGGQICAFFQGTNNNGVAHWKAKQLLGFIKDHSCGVCGSVPLNFPDDNNVDSAGQLTVNWTR